jgi:hypothetical protein
MLWIALFFAMAGTVGFAEIADGWVLEQISDSGYQKGYPLISQGNVVWQEYREGLEQIFFWDGNTIQQISEAPADSGDPQISGTNVAWRQYTGGITQIMLFNGTETIQLTSGTNYRQSPCISGDWVVWIEQIGGIYTVLLWNGTGIQSLSSLANTSQAVIDGNQVAWVESSAQKIKLWDPNGVSQITQTTNYVVELGISGNQLIWLESSMMYPPQQGKVMLWDGASVGQISATSGCTRPRLSQGHAAWIENEQIMYWDGSTVSSLTANSKEKVKLAISQSRVIWNEQPSLVPVYLLYLWEGSQTIRFTDMPGSNTPAIDQDKIVWLAYDADYDLQVYYAYPGTLPAVIPGDINQDHAVNILDLSILSENWLK